MHNIYVLISIVMYLSFNYLVLGSILRTGSVEERCNDLDLCMVLFHEESKPSLCKPIHYDMILIIC